MKPCQKCTFSLDNVRTFSVQIRFIYTECLLSEVALAFKLLS